MQLDDFVSQTLKQIIDGVSTAQNYARSKNANINPSSARYHSSTEGLAYCSETGIPLQNVEFDVAVTVAESQSNNNGSPSVGAISVTSSTETTTQNSSVSRIKFKVPVLLPHEE
jgi:hypothetical protein